MDGILLRRFWAESLVVPAAIVDVLSEKRAALIAYEERKAQLELRSPHAEKQDELRTEDRAVQEHVDRLRKEIPEYQFHANLKRAMHANANLYETELLQDGRLVSVCSSPMQAAMCHPTWTLALAPNCRPNKGGESQARFLATHSPSTSVYLVRPN